MPADPSRPPGTTSPSYVDCILLQARFDGRRPAIGTESGVLTYGQLAEAIAAATTRCAAAGLAPGTLVGLTVADPVWQVVLICALHRLGVISTSLMPAEAGLPLGMSALLYDRDRPAGFTGTALQVDPGWFAAQPGRPPATPVRFGPRDVCRVALSSGTTGEPKPIAMSEAVLWDRITTYLWRGSMAAVQRVFCGPQMRSHFGFMIAFTALATGKMVCFAQTAATAVPVIAFAGAELAIVSVQQLGELAETQERSLGGLATLREIQAGGSHISEALVRRLRAVLPVPIVNTYASTEAGVVALASVEQLAERRDEGAVGFLVPWATVEACDEAGRPLPAGETGSLRIRALGLAAPWRPGSTTMEPMDAFSPGDHGRVLETGMLVVGGRTNDVINFGGVKLAAELLDRQVTRCKGVRDAGVIAVEGRSGLPEIVVAVVAGGHVDEAEIGARCAEVAPFARPVAVHRVEAIPRNAMGKIVRSELRRTLAAGTGPA
ncbi:AMP-binding protein [Rhodoplanes sp. TEM]|uniref:AMP-binding protein n=1 Tax=Rhodoplanes tepidamans TaxID=200616 RepID=A0ABT5JD82_RHOTP|nr:MULTISPECIES: AMP-binding protein [Rhodoplanes]MDC7787463.1 AMP-binding protein [Rhodoplanes tepidamans]MDC7985858.1 AMP-binding protein [Rhodoplanes sp. TEM]MDQ0354386.1 acyl-coenzyme A synthetase/AMP-(fatty) acid ligase [Rhodoplanes tepidamans]